MRALDSRELQLLNDFQHDFPLERAPYAAVARTLGVEESWVRARLAAHLAEGTVSRVGAVFTPGTIGASVLAAMAVPDAALERVAAIVSARPEVNHNYEREHRLNLWFVATAPDRSRLGAALAAIGRDSGIAPIALPLVTDYAIDLGFDFTLESSAPRAGQARAAMPVRAVVLSDEDHRLIAALEEGLPLVTQPYAALAAAAGMSEAQVLARLSEWLASGVIKRLGIVVRHRSLGFVANAMCVWDVPDGEVDALGRSLARAPGVTLCYRRTRALPDWRYNLFCMIHGRDRHTACARHRELAAQLHLDRYPADVLFSRRAFKQRGAHYAQAPAAVAALAI